MADALAASKNGQQSLHRALPAVPQGWGWGHDSAHPCHICNRGHGHCETPTGLVRFYHNWQGQGLQLHCVSFMFCLCPKDDVLSAPPLPFPPQTHGITSTHTGGSSTMGTPWLHDRQATCRRAGVCFRCLSGFMRRCVEEGCTRKKGSEPWRARVSVLSFGMPT